MATSKGSEGLSIPSALALGFGGLALLIWSFLPDSFTEPVKYSIFYDVPTEHVYFSRKPHDCDYEKAPLGNKECHFTKQVIVTHIDGNNPNSRATDVYIGWDKVEDQ